MFYVFFGSILDYATVSQQISGLNIFPRPFFLCDLAEFRFLANQRSQRRVVCDAVYTCCLYQLKVN